MTAHGPSLLVAANTLGLSANDWTAVAAIAQALAAFGALALLVTTFTSRRDAQAALEQSVRLARETEAMALASRQSLTLAVQPVLEVRRETGGKRLRFANVGNGPLIGPETRIGDEIVRLRTRSSDGVFVEAGALRVGQEGILHLDEEPSGELAIAGVTLAGEPVEWLVDPAQHPDDSVFVPRFSSASRGHLERLVRDE